MLEPEREVEMEEDFNDENPMNDNMSLISYSPSRCLIHFPPDLWCPPPEASLLPYPLSHGSSQWIPSYGNAGSSTPPLVHSPLPLLRESYYPSPQAPVFDYSSSHVPPSPKPGFSQWISSDVNVRSSTLPLDHSPLFHECHNRLRFHLNLVKLNLTLSRPGPLRVQRTLQAVQDLEILILVQELNRMNQEQPESSQFLETLLLVQELNEFNRLKRLLYLVPDLVPDCKEVYRLTALRLFLAVPLMPLMRKFNSSLRLGQEEQALLNAVTLALDQKFVQESVGLGTKTIVFLLNKLLLIQQELDRFTLLRQELEELLNSSLRQQLEFILVQELDRLQNENRELHKFVQHASQITLQMKIIEWATRSVDIGPEICEEGHDNASIEILDKMTMEDHSCNVHFSWTKAPCGHRSLSNGGGLNKSCTSFDGCYMHQDCISTVKLEICVEYDIGRFQGKVPFYKPFLCAEYSFVHNKRKIELHDAVSYPKNEGTKKTAKRKTTLEGLQHFSGSRQDAAKHFKVSESTIKRCLRDHNIKDWRDRKIDKNNQCLSLPKDIIESFQGEGAEMGNQVAGGSRSCERKLNHEQIGFPPAFEKGSDRSQIGVDLPEESAIQLETTTMGSMLAPSTHEQCTEVGDHSDLHVQHLRPDAVNSTLPPIPEGELPIENSGRSRELSDHCISATGAFSAKQVPDSGRTNLSFSDPAPKLAKATAPPMMPLVAETQDTKTVTMKATYREDMIRFQLPLTSGIIELRKEVAETLMLADGTFGIKYLDDDGHWILMTRDKDLQECFNISVSLGWKFIELSIHDITQS